ncbi:MAG: ACT domain-containing protein [Solirubrobacterales bacterium]
MNVGLTVREGELAVVRLPAGAPAPEWGRPGAAGIAAVVATGEETSIVCDAASVPAGVDRSGPWAALVVDGPLEHSLTGILASIAVPLADAAVPIFAISTYDTDWVLVPADRLALAVVALRAAGHQVAEPDAGG